MDMSARKLDPLWTDQLARGFIIKKKKRNDRGTMGITKVERKRDLVSSSSA